MGKVLKADCSAGDAYIEKAFALTASWKVQFSVLVPPSTFTALASHDHTADFVQANGDTGNDGTLVTAVHTDRSSDTFATGPKNWWTDWTPANPAASYTADTWVAVELHWDGTDSNWTYDGSALIAPYTEADVGELLSVQLGGLSAIHTASEVYYVKDVQVFDSSNALVFSDDFSSGTLAAWDSTSGSVSVVRDPTVPVVIPDGRVLVAWDDGPLEPSPIWTPLDQGGDFPQNFVSGYDITTGRQSLISQTDTGTATVYINDRGGLFDDRNLSSPYVGKLSGRQILLQLYDPVRAVWEEQFRGLIDDYTYDIDGSAVNASGEPINASIQLECVDAFDYLAGFGLTPGIAGVDPAANGDPPPAGSKATIYYAETAGSVQDRIIEVMADVGIDTTMYIAASGNVRVQAAKYDPDEAALTVLRDCADAELPFIATIYVNRHGQFCFRGRYSRFYPDDTAAEPGSQWDFHRWAVGDGPAIQSDPTRAQMRVLSYARSRSNIINAAVAYPQGIKDADMPGQVFANVPSITAYGKHTPPGPLSNLLTLNGTVSGNNANTETALYAELLVKNQKDPRVTLTALQLKSINPTDPRASVTWALITQCDISDIVNVAVGYPGGTGFTGDSPQDDYYIEGRHMTVRPANSGYDSVELDLEVSAAVWSMDTHGVFPNPFA